MDAFGNTPPSPTSAAAAPTTASSRRSRRPPRRWPERGARASLKTERSAGADSSRPGPSGGGVGGGAGRHPDLAETGDGGRGALSHPALDRPLEEAGPARAGPVDAPGRTHLGAPRSRHAPRYGSGLRPVRRRHRLEVRSLHGPQQRQHAAGTELRGHQDAERGGRRSAAGPAPTSTRFPTSWSSRTRFPSWARPPRPTRSGCAPPSCAHPASTRSPSPRRRSSMRSRPMRSRICSSSGSAA